MRRKRREIDIRAICFSIRDHVSYGKLLLSVVVRAVAVQAKSTVLLLLSVCDLPSISVSVYIRKVYEQRAFSACLSSLLSCCELGYFRSLSRSLSVPPSRRHMIELYIVYMYPITSSCVGHESWRFWTFLEYS